MAHDAPQSMDSVTVLDEQSEPIHKGKGRAQQEATERTPLLIPASPSLAPLDDSPTPALARRRLWSKLTFVFLLSLSLCIIIFVLLALLAYSYASYAWGASPEEIMNQALVVRGPDRVDVLNLTSDGGIWVNVEGRMGLDAGRVIGVNSDPGKDGLFRNIWKSMGRWGVQRVDRVSVSLSTVIISSEQDPSTVLASVQPSPVEIPLTANPPSDAKSWLTKISIPLLVYPTSNTSALIRFVQEAWRHGTAAVQADVVRAVVRGGGLDEYSWRRQLQGEVTGIKIALHVSSESRKCAIQNFYMITSQL
jgi:hypothetical protein